MVLSRKREKKNREGDSARLRSLSILQDPTTHNILCVRILEVGTITIILLQIQILTRCHIMPYIMNIHLTVSDIFSLS